MYFLDLQLGFCTIEKTGPWGQFLLRTKIYGVTKLYCLDILNNTSTKVTNKINIQDFLREKQFAYLSIRNKIEISESDFLESRLSLLREAQSIKTKTKVFGVLFPRILITHAQIELK